MTGQTNGKTSTRLFGQISRLEASYSRVTASTPMKFDASKF